jgi:hypothetical protein
MKTLVRWCLNLSLLHAVAACGNSTPDDRSAGSDNDAPIPMVNDWAISKVAGEPGGPGAVDGPALDARMFYVTGLAGIGDKLYFADYVNCAVRELDLATNQVLAFAGQPGSCRATPVDGVGEQAGFRQSRSLAALGQLLYLGDMTLGGNAVLRRIDPETREVRTINDPSTGKPWDILTTELVLAASPSKLYLAASRAIYSYDPITGIFELIAGKPGEGGEVNGDAASARFWTITSMTYDGAGGLLVSESWDLRRVDLETKQVRLLAGNSDGYIGVADGFGTDALFNDISGITAFGSKVYLADYITEPLHVEDGSLALALGFGRIRQYDPASTAVTTIAGTLPRPTAMVGEVDGVGTKARFLEPDAIWANGESIFVGSRSAIRRISIASGEVTLVAGELMKSDLVTPGGLILHEGLLYTYANNEMAIVNIEPSSGLLSTVIGYHKLEPPRGQESKFPVNYCWGLAVADGELYCATYREVLCPDEESYMNVTDLYAVDLRTSASRLVWSQPDAIAMDLIAGGHDLFLALKKATTCSGDDSITDDVQLWRLPIDDATAASLLGRPKLSQAMIVRMTQDSGTFIMTDGTRVLRYDPASDTTATLFGNENRSGCQEGTFGGARFSHVIGIAAGNGGLFLGDAACHTISFADLSSGQVTTLAGDPNRPTSDFEPGRGRQAGFNRPGRLTWDETTKTLYLADTRQNVIARLTPPEDQAP